VRRFDLPAMAVYQSQNKLADPPPSRASPAPTWVRCVLQGRCGESGRRFTPCTETATEYPVLLIDSEAPLPDLHACLRERLNAARILVQDVSDVFRVIEYRGFDTPTAA